MAQSRGNFSLLTLWACVATAGLLMALNLNSGIDGVGWPLRVVSIDPVIRDLYVWSQHGGFSYLAFDLVINVAILSAVGVYCERYAKGSTQRALLEATLADAPKKSDNFLA